MPQETGKLRQAQYEEVITQSDAKIECEVCLTRGHIRWILSQIDYYGWPSRFYSRENAEIDKDKIEASQADLLERLIMACCNDGIPIERRVNETTGTVELSTDGGFTWHPDPQDPRNSGVALPPPVTSGIASDKCDAANSVTKQLQVYVDDILQSKVNELGLVEVALAIVAIALTIWVAPVWALFPALIIPLIQRVFAASAAELTAAMSASIYQQFTCIIFCNMQSDGTMTQAGWVQAINDMNQQFAPSNPLGYNTCRAFMLIYGLLGVNNAAAQGLNYGYNCDGCDCSGCDFSNWEVWDNGTLISQDATHITVQATFGGSQWNAGVRNLNVFACCCNVVITADVEGQPTVIGFIPCGYQNDTQEFMSFTYVGQSSNAFAVAGTTAFTVTFTAGEPC